MVLLVTVVVPPLLAMPPPPAPMIFWLPWASLPTDTAVHHCQLRIVGGDASSPATPVTVNRAIAYRNYRTVSVDAAAAAFSLKVAADDAVGHGQRSATTGDAATRGAERLRPEGIVADDTAVAEGEASVVEDPTSVVVINTAVSDGEAGDGDVRGEIFKHAGSGVAVDRQISSTRAVDGHVVVNLKFAAGQQNRAGDAGGVNRVAVIRNGKCVAQRAGAAVIGVCDHDDVSWQRIAHSHQSFARAAVLGHASAGSVSLCQREGNRADDHKHKQVKRASKRCADGGIAFLS